ncbi:hypothetical protein K461DRAFT_280197 [Myriangium duriaei CBS 260.36]|uniref:Peptidase M6-like domain-containing protein n=1 Tax=Myriangium duriaei CBS 260.36 TaxID=1168546 RepID=A0A9P4MIU3_9PEZI|nr:hypothetical protein K461DRAFT_280197 [Myriangium duriaei CBS 260.36]
MRVARSYALAGLLAGAVSASRPTLHGDLADTIPGPDPASVKIFAHAAAKDSVKSSSTTTGKGTAKPSSTASGKSTGKPTPTTSGKPAVKASSTTSGKPTVKPSSTSPAKGSAKPSTSTPTKATIKASTSSPSKPTTKASTSTTSKPAAKPSTSASLKPSTKPSISGSAKASTSSSGKPSTTTTTKKTTTTTTKSTASPTPTNYGNATSAKYIVAPVPKYDEFSAFAGNYKGAYAESDHFRIWGQNNTNTTIGLTHLEGTFTCFVDHLGWRSSGLSAFDYGDKGPYYKTNYFIYSPLPGADAITTEDPWTGLGFVAVLPEWVNYEGVVSHEYGHVMTVAEPQIWNQTNTRGWFETIAQFVGETYNNSPFCQAARDKVNDTHVGGTLFQSQMTISNSWWSLVDATMTEYSIGNQYQAWPFLSYMTYNPDNYTGFGTGTMLSIFRNYKVNSNETLLHTINRIAAPAKLTVQDVVGQYWARMAFVDYGSPIVHNYFMYLRPTLNYNNTLSTGTNSYKVIPERAPKYMGSSIILLQNTTSSITATVSASAGFTATLVIQGANDGATRYTTLTSVTSSKGITKTATVTPADGESVALVVANTPTTLLMYDPQHLDWSPAASAGLQFTFTLTGANVATKAPGNDWFP